MKTKNINHKSYEAYSSVQFVEYQNKLNLNEIVPSKTAQIENDVIVQALPAQIRQKQNRPGATWTNCADIVCTNDKLKLKIKNCP